MKKEIRIIPRHALYETEFKEMANDFVTEDSYLTDRYQYGIDNFDGYMKWWDDIQNSKSMRYQFWIAEKNILIGTINLRLNPSPHEDHIEYEIRPSRRNKGYGKAVFSAAINLAKIFGIEEVSVICEEGNTASQKIIQSFNPEKIGKMVYHKFKIKGDQHGQ